jgi:hypothetical protein
VLERSTGIADRILKDWQQNLAVREREGIYKLKGLSL